MLARSHKIPLLTLSVISSLLLCGCPLGNTAQDSFANNKTITEGDFRIYNKSGKAALVEAYLWDGTTESLTIDVPDETSEGIRITELGGRIGIGVPDEFGVEFKPLDDTGFEPKYLPSLSKKLTQEMEEENEKLRQEYMSDQWLYNRTAYYIGADAALYDGQISFEELEFTVNLGKNIEGIEVLDYSRTKPEWAYLGIRQDNGNIIFYQPVYSFNCDKDNQNFYSKEGKLYSKESNDVVELNYPDGTAEPEDYIDNANDGDEAANVIGNDEGAQNMVRTDAWAATEHLSDKTATELTLPARNAEPVKISFTENNSLPIMAQKDIKAEAFADENAVKSKMKKLPEDSNLSVVRTDAETFIDVIDVYEDNDIIYRLYITGNDEDGFMINGEPAEELVTTGYLME